MFGCSRILANGEYHCKSGLVGLNDISNEPMLFFLPFGAATINANMARNVFFNRWIFRRILLGTIFQGLLALMTVDGNCVHVGNSGFECLDQALFG
jgi:hypothetical protein